MRFLTKSEKRATKSCLIIKTDHKKEVKQESPAFLMKNRTFFIQRYSIIYRAEGIISVYFCHPDSQQSAFQSVHDGDIRFQIRQVAYSGIPDCILHHS